MRTRSEAEGQGQTPLCVDDLSGFSRNEGKMLSPTEGKAHTTPFWAETYPLLPESLCPDHQLERMKIGKGSGFRVSPAQSPQGEEAGPGEVSPRATAQGHGRSHTSVDTGRVGRGTWTGQEGPAPALQRDLLCTWVSDSATTACCLRPNPSDQSFLITRAIWHSNPTSFPFMPTSPRQPCTNDS